MHMNYYISFNLESVQCEPWLPGAGPAEWQEQDRES